MPRTEGVSSSSRVRCILLRPRPISVSRWPGLRPIGDPVWVTFTVFFSDIWGLRRRGLGRRLVLARAEQVGDLLAPPRRDRPRAGRARQRREGRLDHVVRVGRAGALGDDVTHAQRLEHRAHRAASDDAGTGGGRPQKDPAGAELADDVVVQRPAFPHRHADHGPLRLLGRLADRLRHLARLAGAPADPALLVAHDDERREAEAPAAFDHLGDAVDGDELVLQLVAVRPLLPVLAAAVAPTAATAVAALAAMLAAAAAMRGTCHYEILRTTARPRGRRRPGP